ncbi:MAG: hypothetical protein KFF72_13905 [Arthrospira sp. SH-MAG29]|nr:hypothetical protein [Arthrospira sp. SH-MAG29]MBS0017421.1 hypothetical protein [Arthrospira sp. SH-MAG29]
MGFNPVLKFCGINHVDGCDRTTIDELILGDRIIYLGPVFDSSLYQAIALNCVIEQQKKFGR